MPFLCFEQATPNDAYVVPCEPCAVGIDHHEPCEDSGSVPQTYNGSGPLCQSHYPGNRIVDEGCNICSLENRLNVSSPECATAQGITIIQCSSRPYGALAAFSKSNFTGTFVRQPDNVSCAVQNEDGFGATVSCADPSKILRGGYGYNADIKSGIYTNRILIQPLNSGQSFNIIELGLELLNITEFTGLFAAGLERQVFSKGPNMVWTQILVVTILAIILLVLLIVHFGLTYDEINTVIEIKKATNKQD
jgi:hypothetical protein